MTVNIENNEVKGGVLTSFRTKFIALIGTAVLLSLLLSGGVALWNVHQLSRDASREIEQGLSEATEQYLTRYIDMTAQRATLMFARTFDQVTALAQLSQSLIDDPQLGKDLGSFLDRHPAFQDKMNYNAAARWSQNQPGEPSVISVWSYLLDAAGNMRPDVADAVRGTSFFDLVVPSLMGTGQSKLQMYYVGPKSRPIMRTMPYSDQAQTFDKLYPGNNDQNFWDFFFPGVYEAWQRWLKDPGSRPAPTDITIVAPYIDAITGKLIVSYFHPLYTKQRDDVEGMVAVDITLEQLTELVQGVKIADTGFAFLAQQDGNVLTVNTAGEALLGIEQENATGSGVTGINRILSKSRFADVAALKMPAADQTLISHVTVERDGKPEGLLIALHPLQQMNLWQPNAGIVPERLMLGFVVPDREIYASLYAAQKQIDAATTRIVEGILISVIAFLIAVLAVSIMVSRRFTAGLVALADAATRLTRADYNVQVPVRGRDEVARVTAAFNSMARDIRNHTETLEQRVADRTRELASATEEIQQLYEKLRDENLRMGAELDVARRLQMMVLPNISELSGIPELEMASYVEPADEVGGDYYDVLYAPGGAKIGIGDVTGHGIESGVLMIMVQSVGRALYERGIEDPCAFLEVLNTAIYKNIERTKTGKHLSLAFVDYSSEQLTISGQHEEAIIIRNDGSAQRIDTIDLGFPIGLEENIHGLLSSVTVPFQSGDMLILYTDGITEAESEDGVLFGIERLVESACRVHRQTAVEAKTAIIADVRAHIGKQKVHDDITLVVVKHR
ncbi:SpoIIE family protein phosphatase [Aestuariivirga sp.]|jgi:sigma-B regulation protein RsbU (phosphoserine phosphatase)|uniref:SpoIIE family protein phosphatase n=1 Tax=Aestuariivirga sp. TaxID=2650926 RepID=UPI0037851FA2